MKKYLLDEMMIRVYNTILERFGESIGNAPALPGVPDERMSDDMMCQICGMSQDECLCESKKKKGPSKKAAKSWIKGTKKFSDKVAKAKKAGMKNPEGFAAWMMHKATNKWPNEK